MTAKLYKIFVRHEDEITGLGKQWTIIKQVYAYQHRGKTYLSTSEKNARARNIEEINRTKRKNC